MSPLEPLPPRDPRGAERPAAGSLFPAVEAPLVYVVSGSERGVLYMYPPPPGVPRLSGQYEARRVTISDARPILVRGVTGATEVLVFDHNLRSARGASPGVYEPVRRVHNDYTHASALRRVRQLLGEAEAERRLQRRLAIINVWRPLFGPVQDVPLAVCDARSIEPRDLEAINLLYRDRIGENFSFAYNPGQRWYYVSDMQADEVLLLECYDTAADGRCPFTAHSAFDHPHAPAGARSRESIEIRTLAFFDAPARSL